MKIAIGGQLNKQEIQEAITRFSNGVFESAILTDMDAAMKVKSGEYDIYVGACQSGAGGALGMAYSIVGRDKCKTIAMAGRPPKEKDVAQAVSCGIKAYGFTNDQVESSIKLLVKQLTDNL